jgi:hypothetical protein
MDSLTRCTYSRRSGEVLTKKSVTNAVILLTVLGLAYRPISFYTIPCLEQSRTDIICVDRMEFNSIHLLGTLEI